MTGINNRVASQNEDRNFRGIKTLMRSIVATFEVASLAD
jgi:hypothetical protein